MNKLSKLFSKILFKLRFKKVKYYQKSYSQTGEDLIINFIFSVRGLINPSYLDIGAFHPEKLSNTMFFYKNGSRGINIEPNPSNFHDFLKIKPLDLNLNIGIGVEDNYLDYYNLSDSTLNSFDYTSIEKLVSTYGIKIISKLQIPVLTIGSVFNKNQIDKFPDILSLDVEGYDLDILKSIDYKNNFPKVICVETIEYTQDGTGQKNYQIIDFLTSNGYLVFADTFINTIFVKKEFWLREN